MPGSGYKRVDLDAKGGSFGPLRRVRVESRVHASQAGAALAPDGYVQTSVADTPLL